MNSIKILSERLVNDFWHLVGHKSEVLNNQDFIKFKLHNREIVVSNDNGNLVAFDNICPHRGARIFIETHGTKSITCPYHAWTYANGQLRIPNKKAFKNCDIDSADINKFKLEFCGDFIFIGINPKASLINQLSDLKPVLEDISFNISTRLDFDSYSFECIFPIAIENALESEHVEIIHKNTLSGLKLQQEGEANFFGDNISWKAIVGNEKTNNNLQKISKNFNIISQYQGYQTHFIHPFAMISSTYGYSYSMQNFFPGDNNVTNFNSRYYPSHVKEGSESIMEFFYNEGVKMNGKIFKEDADICARVSQESWSIEMPKYSRDIDDRLRFYRGTLKLILEEGVNK